MTLALLFSWFRASRHADETCHWWRLWRRWPWWEVVPCDWKWGNSLQYLHSSYSGRLCASQMLEVHLWRGNCSTIQKGSETSTVIVWRIRSACAASQGHISYMRTYAINAAMLTTVTQYVCTRAIAAMSSSARRCIANLVVKCCPSEDHGYVAEPLWLVHPLLSGLVPAMHPWRKAYQLGRILAPDLWAENKKHQIQNMLCTHAPVASRVSWQLEKSMSQRYSWMKRPE